MSIERLLYSFMDDPYRIDLDSISEDQLPSKRDTFKSAPYSSDKVDYLTNKFRAEFKFLSKKEKSAIDISIIS